MKKALAIILALTTVFCLFSPALADGASGAALSESWTGEVISMQVSLYNQPNSGSGYSRRVPNGTQFYILERSGNWVYCAVPNAGNTGYDYGWIMTYYIVENPTHIVLRSNSGVYAYAAPYNNDKRVGTVSSYQRFTVIATTGNYYIVSFRNAVCYLPMNADYWVEEDLRDIVNGASTPYTVTADKTRVYGYPSTQRGYIDTYSAGTRVDVLYTQDGYAAIRYENVIAFININSLTSVY